MKRGFGFPEQKTSIEVVIGFPLVLSDPSMEVLLVTFADITIKIEEILDVTSERDRERKAMEALRLLYDFNERLLAHAVRAFVINLVKIKTFDDVSVLCKEIWINAHHSLVRDPERWLAEDTIIIEDLLDITRERCLVWINDNADWLVNSILIPNCGKKIESKVKASLSGIGVSNYDNIEDICQDIWIRVKKSLNEKNTKWLNWDGEFNIYFCVGFADYAVKEWNRKNMERISAETSLDYLREVDGFEPEYEGGEVDIETKDIIRCIEQELFRLSEIERNVIFHKYWLNLSYKEIELILNIPVDTAMQHASRGIRKLRNYLKHYDIDMSSYKKKRAPVKKTNSNKKLSSPKNIEN